MCDAEAVALTSGESSIITDVIAGTLASDCGSGGGAPVSNGIGVAGLTYGWYFVLCQECWEL